jgi:hypothetical protein
MFGNIGFRPLWPVIFFLPWLFLGIAWLLESLLHRNSATTMGIYPKSRRPPAGVQPAIRAKRRG